MANLYLALYKGKKTGINPTALLARFSDWITRKLTKGPYSHCEIAIERIEYTSGHHYEHELHYDCYSSSIRHLFVMAGYDVKRLTSPKKISGIWCCLMV